MHRTLLLAVLLQLALAFPARADDKPTARRPNILFIYTDDQSFRTLGCYRDMGAWDWVTTPNIDRLAAEGTRFTHAYGAAWCTPSRACVLTGLLPHGVQGANIVEAFKGSYDPDVCRFWPADLRKAGYHTAMIGKWHFGHDAGPGRNWDHSVVWDQADKKKDWYNDQLLSIDGQEKKIVTGYSTDVYTQYAVDYLKRKHDKPWLLWLCYGAPHLPYTVHPRHKDQYKDAEVRLPSNLFAPHAGKPDYVQKIHRERGVNQVEKGPDGKPVYKGQPLAEVIRAYNRMICAVDEGVGKLRKALEETGQLDNTLVVFTSDQGFAHGEHGFVAKMAPYDACLKMPLLVRLPGVAAKGAACAQPVTVVDLPPTLLAQAGVPQPWKMHGQDLTPLLKEPATEWARAVIMEHFQWQFGTQTDVGVTGTNALRGIPWWIFLRSGSLKYIRTLAEDEVEELYDLDADPGELKNLALDPTYRKVVEDCRAMLLVELQRTGGTKLVKNLPPPRKLP